MSEGNPIRIFVSHAFEEDAEYLRVFEFLESNDRFFYLNCSKPENLPPTAGLELMKEELLKQIGEAEAVVVTLTSYMLRPDLVRFQLSAAEAQEKPVIVMESYGGAFDIPDEVKEKATQIIEWNERNMIDMIARHARLTETSRWEVIDFP